MESSQNLPSLPSDDITALELLTFMHKQHFEELYPNLWVALVSEASGERSFSEAHQHLPTFIHQPGRPHGLQP